MGMLEDILTPSIAESFSSIGVSFWIAPKELNYVEIKSAKDRSPEGLLRAASSTTAGPQRAELKVHQSRAGIPYLLPFVNNQATFATPLSFNTTFDDDQIRTILFDFGQERDKARARPMVDPLFRRDFASDVGYPVNHCYVFSTRAANLEIVPTSRGDIFRSSLTTKIVENHRAATVRLTTGLYRDLTMAFCKFEYWLHHPSERPSLAWVGKDFSLEPGVLIPQAYGSPQNFPHGHFVFRREPSNQTYGWAYIGKPKNYQDRNPGYDPLGAFIIEPKSEWMNLLCLNKQVQLDVWGKVQSFDIEKTVQKLTRIAKLPTNSDIKFLWDPSSYLVKYEGKG